MKAQKLFAGLALAAAIATAAAPAGARTLRDDVPVDPAKLPKQATEFIGRHFAAAPITHATVDREILDTEYDVYLDNGDKLKFDGRGQWKELDCRRNAVPASALPAGIAAEVEKRFPERKITQIERDDHRFEVRLDNRAELLFTLDGRWIGYDD